jgi:hypothetical protein
VGEKNMIFDQDGKQAKCQEDQTPLKHYDGALGYEAIYCPKCGRYSDVHGNTGYWRGYNKK